jgi:malonate-semialdehyde dehydrogenase (acetylating)/methylmalonate-semialdehyde dehydrogenase
MKYDTVPNFIGGRHASGGTALLDVFDPSVGQVISQVPLGGAPEVDAAVQAAKRAAADWAATPIKERVQVFYRYTTLLERDLPALSALVSEENGKIEPEARAEIEKAIEVVEFACSLPQIAH